MQYPFDIVDYFTKKSAFAISAHFTKREGNEERPLESPLKVFDDDYSRFVMTIITGKKGIFCNIPIGELAGIRSKTDFATNQYYAYKYSAASSKNTSPAYTLRFKTGALIGKTAVEVLLENGKEKGGSLLNEQYKSLKSNIEKYPGNKDMMDAIVEAGKMDFDQLSKESVYSAPAPVPLLEITARPLINRKQSEDGKNLCYEGSVVFDSSRDYPITATVKNYYAPVVKREDGTLNVQLSKKNQQTEVINKFSMSVENWLNVVTEMEEAKKAFKNMHYANAFQIAKRADIENRQASTRIS